MTLYGYSPMEKCSFSSERVKFLSSGEITESKSFSFIANLKINCFFLPPQENLETITTQVVLFRVWFMCLLLVGTYVCKLVCHSVGWGVMLGIGFVCLLVGGYVIA